MSVPLFLFTFNCAKLPQTDFSKLYDALPSSETQNVPEILVFGFQEVVPILDSTIPLKVNERLFELNDSIHDVLNQKYPDVPIHTVNIHNLGAIGMIIMTPFQSAIKGVDNAVASCGIFFSSLKGAVGARLTYNKNGVESEFTFVTAHLSANEGYVERRNRDSWRLLRSLEFNDGWSVIKPQNHCFFMGDLNYRVAIYGDELKKQMDDLKVFKGFEEQDVQFDPSYKYIVGELNYNPKRIASWCDRILYLKYPGNLKMIRYDKLQFQTSDHQPVFLSIVAPFQAPQSVINKHGYLIEGGEYLKSTYTSKLANYAMILSDASIGLSLKGVSTTPGRIVLVGLILFILWLLR